MKLLRITLHCNVLRSDVHTSLLTPLSMRKRTGETELSQRRLQVSPLSQPPHKLDQCTGDPIPNYISLTPGILGRGRHTALGAPSCPFHGTAHCQTPTKPPRQSPKGRARRTPLPQNVPPSTPRCQCAPSGSSARLRRLRARRPRRTI